MTARRMRLMPGFLILVALVACAFAMVYGQSESEGPTLVVETSKGTFTLRMFPEDAPKTVAHVADLARRGFYDGQRVHRVIDGLLVQWGDPRSRDTALETEWGRGVEAASGTPVGAAEMSKRRTAVRGAVGLAHPGLPSDGDSQIFVLLDDRPDLNNRYVFFGQLVAGADVVRALDRADLIVKTSVKE